KTTHELLTRAVENVIPKELAIKKLQAGGALRIYLGIDPTGAKLHLGHSVGLRKLKAFSDAGHHVIFLVGSFTAMIGDPTDRDAARAPLTKSDVEQNFQTYKKQAEKILDFSKVEIRYNHEWLAPLTFSEIVKLAGNFTVQHMLQRDMFEKRMSDGKPIGLHEFLYPLMVGYDSVVLDVDCEMGGSDQEFNMLAGRHLQKVFGKREKFVLTTRLIEGADGRKMSKSYGNCVYLEDVPNEMFGKIMSIKDELTPVYFECMTELPMENIKEIISGHPKDAKVRLACEIVALYHGVDAAVKAEADWRQTFSEGGVPENIQTYSAAKNTLILAALSEVFGESNASIRRLFQQTAISEVGGEIIYNHLTPITRSITLRIGKHRFLKIIVK
ncbi:MAG: tyrosine--tRNA ligase, partial [bacterium]|nr:tyrosine--tRNA ligase [bacterium]